MRILVVDDNREMAYLVKQNLESEYFAVDVAHEGSRGLFMARTNSYDAIILDFVLPKMNGNQICQTLRSEGKTMPILMMSVKTEIPDKVDVLNIGADDYLVKPFSSQELIARVRALLRRPANVQRDILQFQDLEMDVLKHTVTRADKPILLTRKEYMLLECLLRHQEDVVTRAMLMDHVWGSELDTFSNTLETHILNLRKKLETINPEKIIQTVSGVGYAIRAET